MNEAANIALLFWPEFKVVDDLVFFAWCAPACVGSGWFDKTDVESSINHVHVLDCFVNRASLPDAPWYDQKHPDFLAARSFGRLWARAVASKLASEFPKRDFRVYYSEQDNPVVRFHQCHPQEKPWMPDEFAFDAIAAGILEVHRVTHSVAPLSDQ